MSIKDLTEQEIRTRYITPAIQGAGWQPNQIREEVCLTAGQIHPRGRVAPRGRRIYAAMRDALEAEVVAAEEVRGRLLQAVLNGK